MAGALLIVGGAPVLRASGMTPRHAFVRGVSPAANANLVKTPSVAMVQMGEEGLGGDDDALHVWGADGTDHAGPLKWQTTGADTVFSTPLSSMSPGWYLAGSHVVSSDGHPVAAWWSFGVNGRTPSDGTKKITLANTAAPAGLPARLVVSVNGLRTGKRSVVSAATWGAVTNVRWVLQDGDTRINGAWLDWGAVHDAKKKTDTAAGVVPRAGTWAVVVTVRAKSRTGWHVSTWSAGVTVRG